MKRVLILFFCFIIFSTAALADYSAICTAQNVNLRTESKSKATSLGRLRKNEEITVISESDDWCYINCSLGEGYIPAKYVQATAIKTTEAKKSSAKATKSTKTASGTVTNVVTSKNMTVTVKASCKDKNHVGNKWSYAFKVGNQICKKGSSTKVPMTAGQEITFYSEITEDDKSPDVGLGKTKYYVSEQDLKTGFTIEQRVEVMEDRGRYSGYSCYWDVTFTVKP